MSNDKNDAAKGIFTFMGIILLLVIMWWYQSDAAMSRRIESLQDDIADLENKIGELTEENEFLREELDAWEEGER